MIASAFYVTASTSLFLAYLTSYFGPAQETYYHKWDSRRSWATDELISIFGVINAMCWLLGFAVMIDWLTYDDVKRHPGYVARGVLWGVILKEIASVLFNVQPWSYLIDPHSKYLEPGVGVPWSNFVGIVFYLTGNIVEFCFLVPHYSWTNDHNNWPIYGTFMAVAANWFICTANAMDYFNKDPWFAPPTHPAIAPYQLKLIIPFQIIGALLLWFGCALIFVWAYTSDEYVVDWAITSKKITDPTADDGLKDDLYQPLRNDKDTLDDDDHA